jgi:hypothetical protein
LMSASSIFPDACQSSEYVRTSRSWETIAFDFFVRTAPLAIPPSSSSAPKTKPGSTPGFVIGRFPDRTRSPHVEEIVLQSRSTLAQLVIFPAEVAFPIPPVSTLPIRISLHKYVPRSPATFDHGGTPLCLGGSTSRRSSLSLPPEKRKHIRQGGPRRPFPEPGGNL